MSTPAIVSSTSQVVESVTSRVNGKDIALYAAGGALVCTTCYLLMRNFQLSARNSDMESALTKSFEAQTLSNMAIKKVLKEVELPSAEVSSVKEEAGGVFSFFTASTAEITNKVQSVSEANLALLNAAQKSNDEAQEAISKAMPKYRPELGSGSKSNNTTIASEFARGVASGMGEAAGQELVKGSIGLLDPARYFQQFVVSGAKWVLNIMDSK